MCVCVCVCVCVHFVPPPDIGSYYYNDTATHTAVLMAIGKENYEFILANFGVNRCMLGGVVLECTEFYNMLTLLTYVLHGARVLLEKLKSFQLVNKFPAFYGTRRFITAFRSARHLSVS